MMTSNAGAAPQTFAKSQLVRFKHCDSAGIVFYPRYFEMINDLVEDWFADAIGLSFGRMHLDYGLGVPTVDLQCRFTAPSRLGERLQRTLAVAAAGRSSLTLAIRFAGEDGVQKLEATVVIVFMDLDVARAVPMPDSVRAALAPWLPVADFARPIATDSPIELE